MPALHQRKRIRDATKAALVNQTIAGERVATTRKIPWRAKDLPAIGVYSLVEPVDADSAHTAPRELTRRLQLAIEAAIRADSDTIDDDLDAIALEIERAIAADDTLGGTAGDAVLANTEFEFGEQGDQEIGVVRLTFAVTYFTHAPDADDVALVDLKTVDTKFTDLDGGADIHAANQAEDKLQNLDV